MLAINIDNPEIENRFKQYAKQHKKAVEELASEALKMFLELNKKDDELIYTKKDPMNHLHKINYKYEDDGEDLSDVKPFSHIDDVAKYVHDIRRVRVK
jgi:hypothetical protein